jgi:REP element-mobilizing transposase RayT
MARVKRIESIGVHYISNRTVELRNAFIVSEDYRRFIDFLCALSLSHKFDIHSYVLLPHAYYLLIETKKENLSVAMKYLNGEYSRYFNQKYGRNGSLWDGRYKSSFMQDKSYAFYFLSYMENLPKMAGITSELRSYSYSTYRQFVGLDERLKCVKNSIVFKRFNTIEEIKAFFVEMRNKEFIENIIEILRLKSLEKKVSKKIEKEIDLETYFFLGQSDEEIAKSMIRVQKMGISQAKIGNFLGVTQQAVYYKIKKHKQKIGKRK